MHMTNIIIIELKIEKKSKNDEIGTNYIFTSSYILMKQRVMTMLVFSCFTILARPIRFQINYGDTLWQQI